MLYQAIFINESVEDKSDIKMVLLFTEHYALLRKCFKINT